MLKLLSITLATTLIFTSNINAKTITSDQIEWGHLNPARGDASPSAGKLWGDRTKDGPSGFLVKFKKGFSSPPHIHNVTYKGLVIKGLVHNDDPKAENMWLPEGSFWTQPAGEAHITSAQGQENLAYIEIDSGPYLVQPTSMAFDNGERPVNIDKSNLVWLDASDIKWVSEEPQIQRAFLWGKTKAGNLNGNLVKLPKGFNGTLENMGDIFHAVIISGSIQYHKDGQETVTLEQSNYFGVDQSDKHFIHTKDETVIYARTNNKFKLFPSPK